MTLEQQTVNQNTAATDSIDNPLSNFDTSEADAVLAGIPVESAAQTVKQSLAGETQTEQPPQQIQFTPEQIEVLRQQLNVNQATDPLQQPVDSQQAIVPNYSEAYTAANGKFKESTGLEFGQAIDEYMVATVGTNLKDTIGLVQSMSQYISERQGHDAIEQSTNELRGVWGNNFDANMQLARAEFDKLPEQTQEQKAFKKSLNNSQGAQLLLARALQNGQNTAVARTPVQYNPFSSQSPQNALVTNGNQPQLRMSEILQMTDAQYRSEEVQQKLRLGVIDDIGAR